MDSRVWCCGGLAASWCFVAGAFAQGAGLVGERPYDGIQAGLDAFRLAEERRQAEVAGQVALNEFLFYWPVWPGLALPPSAAGGRARQPVGQRQEQTGERRWESHPVYAPPLTPYLPLPPVASPWLDNTPYAAPRVLQEPPAAPFVPRESQEVPPLPPRLHQPSRGSLREPQPPPPPQPGPVRRGPREY